MDETKYPRFTKFMSWLYNHLFAFFLIISFILIWLSYNDNFEEETRELLKSFGFAVFASGIFAAVLKSIQFAGIFKTEIEKVMLSTTYLSKAPDLLSLWKSISKIIYKKKFPEISDYIESRILSTYFPTKKDYYYKDFIVTINIEELTNDLTIKYTQHSSYNVVLSDQVDQVALEFSTTFNDPKGESEIINNLVYFKVDDVDVKVTEITDNKGIIVEKVYKVVLKGKGPFNIKSKYERQYSLKNENFKLFRVKTFTKSLEAVIKYPSDVVVSFFNIGNVKEFDKLHEDIENQICRSHKNDVLLPYQGFGMSFNKKN